MFETYPKSCLGFVAAQMLTDFVLPAQSWLLRVTKKKSLAILLQFKIAVKEHVNCDLKVLSQQTGPNQPRNNLFNAIPQKRLHF